MAKVIGSSRGVITGSTDAMRDAAQPNKCLRTAAFAAYALMTQRIFAESGGKAADGVSFGNYSAGYLDLRKQKENRSNTAVNLVFTGELERSFIVVDNTLGFIQGPNASSRNPNGAQKAIQMELKYGRIFDNNQEEIEKAVEAYEICMSTKLVKYR